MKYQEKLLIESIQRLVEELSKTVALNEKRITKIEKQNQKEAKVKARKKIFDQI